VEGWPLDGYFRAGHPLQVAMRGCVAEACGVDDAVVEEAVDGCGMRTFAVPLAALAYAFGGLASGRLGPSGGRCADAMRAHPALVGFSGAIDTELMRAEPGLVAKIGAEGVLAVGLPDGRGLALKVRDGATRAVAPAGVALARDVLGLAADVAPELVAAPIRNSRGVLVGDVVADGDPFAAG
jgi:L-asparaginase II